MRPHTEEAQPPSPANSDSRREEGREEEGEGRERERKIPLFCLYSHPVVAGHFKLLSHAQCEMSLVSVSGRFRGWRVEGRRGHRKGQREAGGTESKWGGGFERARPSS